ncbi:MAG: DUF5688 family protein [Clostridiales bacterium]|nr:DUF5688 family protein [Clostridiales bacterium]
MMTFEEFMDYMENNILSEWKDAADVRIEATRKNNGITYQGLYIREAEETVAPTIYLEDYYASYRKGEDVESIISTIRAQYSWAMERASAYELDVLDYDHMKDRIIYRLVNFEKNKKMLQECPYVRLYDMVLTFRWVAHSDNIGISTVLVTNQELKLWGISIHELILAAQANTCRLFPPRILSMNEVLRQTGQVQEEFEDGVTMYVLTNKQQINGATVLVYENVLQEFAEDKQTDFYVLPCSIHEMILIPSRELDEPDRLYDMVREANTTAVSPGDVLSDSVYYYNRMDGKVSLLK